jgi:mannose-6-phosphate isomerase-like protein (cupin superfamily)
MAAALGVGAVLLISGVGISGQAKPPVQSSAARPGTLAVTVVSDAGATLDKATVSLRGAVDRQATTGADGVASLLNIPPGTYRARVSREGFFTFEKEVVIRAAAKTATEAALSPAPPPPPPPAPPKEKEKEPVRPVEANGPVGAAKVLSLSDLAEQMLRDPALIVEREIGCSVASASRLILVRETLASHSHADADEMLYLLAGDATLKIGDKDSSISAGWFGLVPRGSSHTLSKRGRNAPIFLSIRSGAPCGS